MKKATHFKCDNCTNIFEIKQRRIVKAAYTAFVRESKDGFQCYHYHIQLCKKCKKKVKEK